MRTVKDFTKLSPATVAVAISRDIKDSIKGRENGYKADYLERHPDQTEVPNSIKGMHKELANWYTLGQVETLLSCAIQDLQTAEATIKLVDPKLSRMIEKYV